jgi:hypothetical protein
MGVKSEHLLAILVESLVLITMGRIYNWVAGLISRTLENMYIKLCIFFSVLCLPFTCDSVNILLNSCGNWEIGIEA